MKSQNDRLLSALRAGAQVTPNYALRTMSIERLAARIGELRAMGEDIQSRFVGVTNQFGKKVRVKAYRLAKGA